ncbi:Dicer-like protein 2 [Arachnomyces sp. PD_36]|nr:Dicer-like protein 2 [Arachnomyces sp. PD_36]
MAREKKVTQPSPDAEANGSDPSLVQPHNGLPRDNEELEIKEVPSILKPRAYQQEMLAESLRQNIIIAMDTGSGKTQIAVLRIREELGRWSSEKLVWFIAPTVALAEQQHAVLSLQLPAFQTKILSGADNVERWTTQSIWDAILLNIRIVVSTPQVLLDALSNGFLRLTRIALLVFDEAHNCISSSPANRIMQNFYHPLKASAGKDNIPSILGLTASPVTKGKTTDLEVIEGNLDAICRTPKLHREEMMQYVHRPELGTVIFDGSKWPYSATLQALMEIRDKLDILDDPLVRKLKTDKRDRSQAWLLEILEKQKTPCRDQLKMLFTRADTIHSELGPWAADLFVTSCVERMQAMAEGKSRADTLVAWEYDEKMYISDILSPIPRMGSPRRGIPDVLSDKAEKLVQLLASEYSEGFRGIVFAQQRSTAVMLTHLLSNHPLLTNIIPGSFVGNSNYAGKKTSIIELTSPHDQKDSINDLRTGKKNLLIATSVLEEGIDVSACNLVMEQVMKDIYSDDMRELEEIKAREDIREDGSRFFPIESTGALLTLDNARPHLDHFCATLSCSYTETRPEFILIEHTDDEKYFTARVILPSLIDPSLRETKGISMWKTEMMAKRDASFQAYVKLYKAGLVNDHLLPRHCEPKHSAVEHMEKRANFAQVKTAINPWITVANEWGKGGLLYQTIIDIVSNDIRLPSIVLLLPVPLACHVSFKLFWNDDTSYTVSFTQQTTNLTAGMIPGAADITHLLLSSIFSSRMSPEKKDFPWLFLPRIEPTLESIESWYASMKGVIPAADILAHDSNSFSELGLARTTHKHTRPVIIDKGIWMKPVEDDRPIVDSEDPGNDEVAEEYHVEGMKVPKRTDFLHPVVGDNPVALAHTARKCFPIRLCSIDRLPAAYARVAAFIPSIVHKLEVAMVTRELSETTLASVGFEDLSLVATAISASSAREDSNYQRIEFFGDSLLKLHASLQLAAMNPLWPEGLLSHGKDRIVSNTRLSKAAVELGLDRFILTQAFTGSKWRPPYISDLLEIGAAGIPIRELSTKVLADVVEALIGAADIDGGEEKTMKCLGVFLPEVKWVSPRERIELLYNQVPEPDDKAHLAIVPEVEALLGRIFDKKMLLLEALTHPCSKGSAMSYQRLEFIGDSILDHLVVHEIFNSPENYEHYDMHLMRTVLVNADFLAFLCLDTWSEEKRGEVEEKPSQEKKGKVEVEVKETTRKRYLWQFMNHSASWEISNAQQVTLKRYETLREGILEALESPTYPWALLSRLEAGKFFSDLIESLLGAVFVDSHGSLDACRIFLEQIGLMRYVRYVTTGRIHRLLHPKQRLGLVAGRSKIRYETRLAETGEGKTRMWMCRVLVDGEGIVEVDDGVSRIEVETKAADAALVVFEKKEMKIASDEVGVDDDHDEVMADV